jgi:hypothetical protein
MFYIEAKVDRNVWVSIGQLSDSLIEFDAGFSTIEEANSAKRKIKNYLKVYEPENKLPIRIVELT